MSSLLICSEKTLEDEIKLLLKSHELSLIKMQHAFKKDILTSFIVSLYSIVFDPYVLLADFSPKILQVCDEAQKRYI